MSWNKYQKSVLGIVTITSFLGTFLVSSINVALPTIEREFNMNAISLSWILTSFLLASAIFLLPSGKWADIKGIKEVYKYGILTFSLTTLLCGISTDGLFLIFFRFLQGIGSAMTASTGTAILVSMFPPMQRGRVLGISVAAVYLGLATGPFIGGLLTQQTGWRSIFFVPSILGFAATIIAFVILKRDSQVENSEKINLKGYIFNLIDIKLFTKNRLFVYSNIAALINYSATFAIIFLLSLYLQHIKKLSPQEAGLILLIQPLVMTIFSPITGRLSDKIEPRFLATCGMVLCTLGLAVFAFLNENFPIPLIISILAIMGLGFSLFSSPNMNTIMSSVEKHQYGTASGIASTMRVLGQMISMTVVTLFFSFIFGKNQTSEIATSLFIRTISLLFVVFAMICAFGIRFSLKRGKVKN